MSFEQDIRGQGLLIKTTNDINLNYVKDLINLCEHQVSINTHLTKIVIFLENKFELDSSIFRVLTPFGMNLRKKGVEIHLIQAPMRTRIDVRDAGMESLLRITKSVEDLNLDSRKQSGYTIDVDFVNPFVDGAIHTLKVQCQLECKNLEIFARGKGDKIPISTDIAGVIGVASEKFKGSIAICFPEKVFLAAMSNMLGEEITEITKDIEDGAGELLNIIFGFAKKVLNENGHTIEKALPSIVRGNNISIKQTTTNPSIIVPFQSQAGSFFIEIGAEEIL